MTEIFQSSSNGGAAKHVGCGVVVKVVSLRGTLAPCRAVVNVSSATINRYETYTFNNTTIRVPSATINRYETYTFNNTTIRVPLATINRYETYTVNNTTIRVPLATKLISGTSTPKAPNNE